VTIGYETVMATVSFFKNANPTFSWTEAYEWVDALEPLSTTAATGHYYVLLEFDKPVPCPTSATLIASRLDMEPDKNQCRIAFHGQVVELFTQPDYREKQLEQLRVYKQKERQGVVDRACLLQVNDVM
jgi:selenocysteine-specific elongation factor